MTCITPLKATGSRRTVSMKYCFQAISPLYSRPRGYRPAHVGVVVAFGRDPYVTKEVGKVARDLQESGAIDHHGEVNLTCFEYCPVEVGDEVFVHFFGRESQKIKMQYTGTKKYQ